MTFADFERAATRTINHSLDDRDRLLDAAAGHAEEAGEVLAQVRKHAMQHRQLSPERLMEELGDALWCIATVAHCAGLSLDQVAASNVTKLEARHPRGFDTPSV
jgi:NTP pyrophosphatase (non-canonical NTP hydrolase)